MSIDSFDLAKRGRTSNVRSLIPTILGNAGRQRLNINGVIDCLTQQAIGSYDDTINAQSTIAFFRRSRSWFIPTGVGNALIMIFRDNG